MRAGCAKSKLSANGKAVAAIILVPDERGLQPVFGIPAIRRLILLVQKLEIGPIHILGRAKSARPAVADLLPPEAFRPLGDAARLARIVDSIGLPTDGRILVLNAHQVIDLYSLRLLAERRLEPGLSYLKSTDNPGECIYLTDRYGLAPILECLWRSAPLDSIGLEKGTQIEGARGVPHAAAPGPRGAEAAEKRLAAALSFQTKADDGVIARHFDRYISAFVSRRVARTPISPNQITFCGAALGLLGACLLSRPDYEPQLTGAFLFLLCVVIDGVDGEVARLKLMESRFGHYLDVALDNVVHLAIFAGMAIGLYGKTGHPLYLHLLWLLAGGFGLCAVAVNRYVLKKTPAELRRSPAALRLLSLLTNRDFAYLVFLLAAIGRLNWFLIGATAGVYLFAASLWAMNFYQNRVVAPKSS